MFPELTFQKIFVIDNSITMQQYKALLLNRLLPLAYVLKQADPDELEVMMTNDCKVAKFKHATELQAHVSRNFHKGEEAPTHMEVCFEKLFEKIKGQLPENNTVGRLRQSVFHRGSRRMNVYFLTDGAWADNQKEVDDGILEDMLKSLADEIQRRGLNRRWVSLQFIRFGHDEQGIAKLTELDDFLDGR